MNITVVHATHTCTLYMYIYIFGILCIILHFIYMYTCIHVGLRITEVAHDIQQQVSRYISAELHLINSYDTWHGMYVHVHVYIHVLIHQVTRPSMHTHTSIYLQYYN